MTNRDAGGPPLNAAQQAAVDHGGAPALVIAGAGSGKTRVITRRIARLLAEGYPARSIVAVTFTNKAAEEMAQRIGGMVGADKAKELRISTFHSLGAEIVRQEARHVTHGDRFVIFDAADTLGVVKEIMREIKVADRKFDAGAVLARISHAKNALTTPDELPAEGEYDELAAMVFPRYMAAMTRLRALDFDDLILVPLRLLREVADVRERWHAQLRHLLVDEFQDTAKSQLLMVQSLTGPRTEVFCVGDDDQAIYGWRGADVRNVIHFTTHFPGAVMLPLEQNYRSTQPVLDVANAVIARAERAWPKKLFSDRKTGPKVTLVECDTNADESHFVAATAKAAIQAGVPRKEIAVLYRGNALSKPVEEAMRVAGIPYRMIGGTSFYERREVKDLSAYLRLAVHPSDDLSFRRVVNYPARGIGEQSFERLERFAKARGLGLFEAAQLAGQVRELDDRARHAIDGFVKLIVATRERIERDEPLSSVARGVAHAIDLRADIVAAGPSAQVAERRLGNLEDLYRSLDRVNASGSGLSAARVVLSRLSLRFAEEVDDKLDLVTLSTLHGAKGLEFGTVMLIGVDEGILPHGRTDAPRATDIAATIDASEERRLFYVGVTRAKDKLYLVRARKRELRGQHKVTAPSRFLQDIPAELLERQNYRAQQPLDREKLLEMSRALTRNLRSQAGKK